MKKNIFITCIIVLAICLISLRFWFRHTAQRETPAQAGTMLTNQPEQPKVVEHRQITNTSPMLSLPESASPLAKAVAVTNPIAAHILAAWQAPIEFYGKVVDENTNPVTGVNIHFNWSELPERGGERTSDTQSDSDGLFSLHGKRGAALTVSFSKQGYYSSGRGEQTFSYAFPKAISPDPQNPVIFHLRKKGTPEPLIHIAGIGLHTMRDFLLAGDGKPTDVSLRDGRLAPSGQGDLEVAFQAGTPLDNFPSRITWQCQVTVPNGGLVQTDEEFPFLAPENGYQASDIWSITATNWTEQVNKQYYLKLGDGNFGRVKLRVIGVPNRAFFRMESFLNPSGSRNLEPE